MVPYSGQTKSFVNIFIGCFV